VTIFATDSYKHNNINILTPEAQLWRSYCFFQLANDLHSVVKNPDDYRIDIHGLICNEMARSLDDLAIDIRSRWTVL